MIYFGILILLNAYKCANVVCAGASRCNLERPVKEHFFVPMLALQFGVSGERKSSTTRYRFATAKFAATMLLIPYLLLQCFPESVLVT
jgi:hypothetical protein